MTDRVAADPRSQQDTRGLTAKDFADTESASLDRVNPLSTGVFMAHQRTWLEDRAPMKLCEKGRRTGITFASSWDDTITAASSRSAGGQNCYYIPDAKAKGLEYIGYVSHFASCIGAALSGLHEYLFEDMREDGSSRFITAWRARFVSGFAVVALSSRPAGVRGLQGRVTVDEAAFHDDVGAVLAAVNALLIWGGEVRVISTHNGVGNPFNALVMEARAGKSPYKLHRYSFDDAVANGLYERVCLKRGIPATEDGKRDWRALILASYGSNDEARQEELFCTPAQGEGAWLSFNDITACEHEDAGRPELYQGGPCTIGNDIAVRGDLWVAWVWEQVGDILWCREISILHKASFAEQDAEMDRLMRRYSVSRAAADQTGMGEKPVEDMKRRYGSIVEGVILTGPTRLNVATRAKQAFEDRKIRIPAGDPVLRSDLHKLKRIVGDTGNPRLVAEHDEAGHADRFWAAALGIAAGSDTPGILDWYRAQAAKNPVAASAAADFIARSKAAGQAGRAALSALKGT